MDTEISDTLLGYLAGFFDGEGCIGINRGRGTSYYLLDVAVSNKRSNVISLRDAAYCKMKELNRRGVDIQHESTSGS